MFRALPEVARVRVPAAGRGRPGRGGAAAGLPRVGSAIEIAGLVRVIHHARRYVRDREFGTPTATVMDGTATASFAAPGHTRPWSVIREAVDRAGREGGRVA